MLNPTVGGKSRRLRRFADWLTSADEGCRPADIPVA